MSKQRLFFTLSYWAVVAVVGVWLCYETGKEEFSKCELAEGVVIRQVDLPLRTRRGATYVSRPQIEFPVGDTSYIFTDDKTVFENGETVNVLYRKDLPPLAKVYTLTFWVDLGIIVPLFIVSSFLFAVIWIKFTNYGNEPVILKGEFDSES